MENWRLTEQEIVNNELERKANLVAHEEFSTLINRVDTMDSSIGKIVNKVCFI